MDLFGFAISAIVVTGAALVLGGMYLIASGAIKLAGDRAGKTEMKFGDLFRMTTTVPGLGIFMLGLAFDCIGLYYANEARRDNVPRQIEAAVKKDREAHAVRLAGFVKMNVDQEVRLSVCMGQEVVVRSNNPFDNRIEPYLDFMIVRLETAGVAPQLFTITLSDNVPPSFKNFAHFVLSHNGVADLGQVQLDQVVNLSPLIQTNQLSLPTATSPQPVGTAYGAAN